MKLLTLALVVASSTALADVKTYKLDGGNLVVPHPILFESGKATLMPESGIALDYVKGYLTDKPYISTLRVEVHSDSDGSQGFNQTLSEKRALVVAKALVKAGIECKRLLPVGFGSNKPIGDNKTAEGKAANRRTVFANAALRGRAIGGMPLDGGGKVAGDPCN